MNIITSFAKSGFWDYRNTIAPLAVALPLGVEAAILAKNIYQNPQLIKDKLLEIFKKASENIFTTIACVAIMAALAYGSIVLLPASMGISVAISAIYLTGKLFINAEKYKNQIIQAFKAAPGEKPEETRKRVIINILKTTALAVGLIAGAILFNHFIVPLITNGFSWSWTLPFQTKGVVFLEYASLGVVHGALAYSKFQKGDKAGALFHVLYAILSIVFPCFYWTRDMRLHHSFYGIAMTALPFRATKILGSIITFDSSLYAIAPKRGYMAGDRFHEYDFINLIIDKFSLFFNGYNAAIIANDINNQFKVKSEPCKALPQ